MNERERYQAGKTLRKTEYGVRFPDGTLQWFNPDFSFDRFESAEGREKYLADRASQFARLNTKDPGVTFVRRQVKTSFTDPEVVA
jgi:hypothetical protein